MKGFSDGLPDQFLERASDLLVLVHAIVTESGREPCGHLDLLVDLAPFLRSHFDQLLVVHRTPHRDHLGEQSILEVPPYRSVDESMALHRHVTYLAIAGYLKLQRVG